MCVTVGTVVNPRRALVDYLLPHASNNLTKAIIAVSTPELASQLRPLASQFPAIQTVAIACDSVPLGVQRNGFSWLVLEKQIEMCQLTPLRPSQSRQWEIKRSSLIMETPSSTINLPAANTLFTTGIESELHVGNSSHLDLAKILLPCDFRKKTSIEPLQQLTPSLKITGCTDNMLKTLDGEPASSFLQNLPELQTKLGHSVYAGISSNGESPAYVKVVAGGGGSWSVRSKMLVLDPQGPTPRVGDHIQFFLATGTLDASQQSQLRSCIDQTVVEVAPQAESIHEPPYLQFRQNDFLPVFGFGSEAGFTLNGLQHNVQGESIHFDTS